MLSPLQCAAQFDLYATSHETEAAKHAARAAESTEHTVRLYALYKQAEWAACAHQLRFAATFLREHAVLRWTKDLPTETGLYWWREGGYPSLVEVWRDSERGLCVDLGDRHRNPVANFGTMEWFGPYAFPTEADGAPSKRRGLFYDPFSSEWREKTAKMCAAPAPPSAGGEESTP